MHGTQLASVGARFMASLVDTILVMVAAVVLGLLLSSVLHSDASSYLLGFLIYGVYFVVPTALSGQTPGKRLMGIRVVNARGEAPGYGSALMREVLGKFLSALPLYLGYLVAVFHPEKRALHDLIGGTWVVVARSSLPVLSQEPKSQ